MEKKQTTLIIMVLPEEHFSRRRNWRTSKSLQKQTGDKVRVNGEKIKGEIFVLWNVNILISTAECLNRGVIINPGCTEFTVMSTPSSCTFPNVQQLCSQNLLQVWSFLIHHYHHQFFAGYWFKKIKTWNGCFLTQVFFKDKVCIIYFKVWKVNKKVEFIWTL